jgi:glycosyltransferase involved in cell wall biosynthesis
MGDPSLSVVVPAHDEADELPATLAGLHAGLMSAGVEYEIIVVDNASMDSTARVAVEAGARVVHEPYRQISRARDTGAAQARGEWLLFVDADT